MSLSLPEPYVGLDAFNELAVREHADQVQRNFEKIGVAWVGRLPAGLGPLPWAGSTAPAGWLLCDGSAVSRTTHSALFAVVGTTYGAGDGSTTFNLPDMRDRVAVGVSGTITRGSTGGAKTHTLTTAEMPSHDHGLNRGVSPAGSNSSNVAAGGTATTMTDGAPVASAGSGDAHNNMQPYLGLNYIIKR